MPKQDRRCICNRHSEYPMKGLTLKYCETFLNMKVDAYATDILCIQPKDIHKML